MNLNDEDINLTGICAIAPFVSVFAGTVLFVVGVSVDTAFSASGGGFSRIVETLGSAAAGFVVVPMIGWLIALPGAFLLGYPVLRLFRRYGIRSYILHGLAGAICGSHYLAALSAGVGWLQDVSGFFVFGGVAGALTGVTARWAMTWQWLRV